MEDNEKQASGSTPMSLIDGLPTLPFPSLDTFPDPRNPDLERLRDKYLRVRIFASLQQQQEFIDAMKGQSYIRPEERPRLLGLHPLYQDIEGPDNIDKTKWFHLVILDTLYRNPAVMEPLWQGLIEKGEAHRGAMRGRDQVPVGQFCEEFDRAATGDLEQRNEAASWAMRRAHLVRRDLSLYLIRFLMKWRPNDLEQRRHLCDFLLDDRVPAFLQGDDEFGQCHIQNSTGGKRPSNDHDADPKSKRPRMRGATYTKLVVSRILPLIHEEFDNIRGVDLPVTRTPYSKRVRLLNRIKADIRDVLMKLCEDGKTISRVNEFSEPLEQSGVMGSLLTQMIKYEESSSTYDRKLEDIGTEMTSLRNTTESQGTELGQLQDKLYDIFRKRQEAAEDDEEAAKRIADFVKAEMDKRVKKLKGELIEILKQREKTAQECLDTMQASLTERVDKVEARSNEHDGFWQETSRGAQFLVSVVNKNRETE